MHHKDALACGSMELYDKIFVVFALAERKNDKRAKSKYRSAAGSERQLRTFSFCSFFARRIKKNLQRIQNYGLRTSYTIQYFTSFSQTSKCNAHDRASK
jgi:hypothetical protein